MYLFFNLKFLRNKKFIFLFVLVSLSVWLLVSLWKSDSISVNSVSEGYYVPVIMYHSILADESLQGKYVISPKQLEEDLVYLSENGYTTVTVKDLISYVEEGIPLPIKPIMLTFDDGYYNNYLYAYPLMKEYGFKMVLSVIGKYSELYSNTNDVNAYYSHCTWRQLEEMENSGYVEIQNHSYNLHTYGKERRGAKKNSWESIDNYTKLLTEDLIKCQTLLEDNVGISPNAFTYPFGALCSESTDIVKELGFKATFSCEEKINFITRDPECLFGIYRFLRPTGESSDVYFESTVNIDKYVNVMEIQ